MKMSKAIERYVEVVKQYPGLLQRRRSSAAEKVEEDGEED
jgi:hypothetical protein